MSSLHDDTRRTDDTRRPEDIENDIERTRAEVSSTIDAIQEKLTPGEMMDQALRYLRAHGAGDFGRNLGRQVRDNPLPVALVGLGVAWLAMGGRRHGDPPAREDASPIRPYPVSTAHDDGEAGERVRDTLSDAAGRVKDSVSGAARRARELAHDAGSRLGGVGGDVRMRAGALQGRTRMQVERARERTLRMADEQPLVLAAVGVAIGAAIGAALPSTRREDTLLGTTRDGLLEGAGDVARDGLRGVASSAQRVARTAREEVERAIDTPTGSAGAGSPSVGMAGMTGPAGAPGSAAH